VVRRLKRVPGNTGVTDQPVYDASQHFCRILELRRTYVRFGDAMKNVELTPPSATLLVLEPFRAAAGYVAGIAPLTVPVAMVSPERTS
jgi:hypothetical protein